MTASSSPFKPSALPWRAGLAYGLLAAPLAFVSLPLYITLPHHYASSAGAPLAALGAVLLLARGLDAVIDPLLGRWADRLFERGTRHAWQAAALASMVLALSFAALWHPPRGSTTSTLNWLALTLVACTLAYSGVSIVHQAWATRWGGSPAWRAGVNAWREGAGLIGVVLASIVPSWLGLNATSAVLGAGLVIGLTSLRGLPTLSAVSPLPRCGPLLLTAAQTSPWSNAAFCRLFAVFMLNGVASAMAATLLPFFVADRLRAAALQPWLLLSYFGAAAVALPLWVRIVARHGLAPSWRMGMVASVLAFAATPALGAGDGMPFALICALSGLALGADLALPAALLTGVIHQAGAGQQAEGRYLGWWTFASKLNLALAAGLALPLLSLVGYHSGSADGAALRALAWMYGALPCTLKLTAAALLWRAEHHHPTWKERT